MGGRRIWWDKECRENKSELNRMLKKMIKRKIERRTYIEKKQEHARLCRNKQEEEKKKEQKKLLEIKDRNEVLKYIKRKR